MNRIRELEKHGQSVWFDYIERGLVFTGALHRMVSEDGLKGVTSNPAIFEKAIAGSKAYQPAMRDIVKNGASALEAFESLAVEDIRMACDVLRPAYDASEGRDGFVSLEVSPHLAYDTAATVEDGHRLWDLVGRENLMIKVPATQEGLPAIEHLIGEGINVNITLLFAVDRYEEVFRAYQGGLERFITNGGDPSRVASVASFFVSRIDAMVDKLIEERLATSPAKDQAKKLEGLRGKIAIANAKMAYRSYQNMIAEERWEALQKAGAAPQRLLWASTSTKNPKYRDVTYIEELIGPDTVNTVPEATYLAFADHGEARRTLDKDVDEAERIMTTLADVDISMPQVTDKLVEQGVVLFQEAFDRLMGTVETRREEILGERLTSMSISAGAVEAKVKDRLAAMLKDGFTRRLWERDGSLFSSDPAEAAAAGQYMGWLDIVDTMEDQVEHLYDLQDDLEADQIETVVLMGMGGSSLAPEVFAKTFGQMDGSPELVVLDSTVPAQVEAVGQQINLESAAFIVASKSGTTIEPLAFDSYFWRTVQDPSRFYAITDPGSKLERMALERDFRGIYNGDAEIGGRYSALSPFGLVPAAAMGLDVLTLLHRARDMVGSCESAVPPEHNPGVKLGVVLGELARVGRDKLTFVTSPGIESLGAWLEQLVAESTGKQGKGIVPVDREDLAAPDLYGSDRVFASFVLAEEEGRVKPLMERLAALEKAGHPVLRFRLADRNSIVQEMFRWEVATATVGHVLGINPFDQPNVQESKTYTAQLLGAFARDGKLPPVPGEVKLFEESGVALYADEANAKALAGKGSLAEALGAHFERLAPGDYAALNAYVEMSPENDDLLQRIRHHVRAKHKVATTVGFGPRFLHSTGQLHKGGPNSGVFLQITCDDARDPDVPGHGYSFGALKSAQQAGDFMALSKRDRRLVRVHLPADTRKGLAVLAKALGA